MRLVGRLVRLWQERRLPRVWTLASCSLAGGLWVPSRYLLRFQCSGSSKWKGFEELKMTVKTRMLMMKTKMRRLQRRRGRTRRSLRRRHRARLGASRRLLMSRMSCLMICCLQQRTPGRIRLCTDNRGAVSICEECRVRSDFRRTISSRGVRGGTVVIWAPQEVDLELAERPITDVVPTAR